MSRWITPALGLLLLAGLVSILDAKQVAESIRNASPHWFFAALLFAIMTNLVCAYRWRYIAGELLVKMTYPQAISLYGQGLAANSVLPGGIIGGDVWRALRLSRMAPSGAGDAGPASVFIDRASGFWGLALVSLAGGVVWAFSSSSLDIIPSQWIAAHFALLFLVLTTPFAISALLRPILYKSLQHVKGWPSRLFLGPALKVSIATPLLLKTAPFSLVAQIFTQLALLSCLKAVGLDVPTALLVGASSGILFASVVPAAIGGFGPREIGAAAILSPFGFSSEALVAGSILFGLTATAQGALSLLFFGSPDIKSREEDIKADPPR